MVIKLADDSFFDLEGKEISRNILVQQMIDFYKGKVEEGKTAITDFNEGSEIRNILESIGVDLYHLEEQDYKNMRMGFIQYATGQFLDLHGERLRCERDYGSVSNGILTFTIPAPLNYPLTIPVNTYCLHKDTGAIYFTTSEVVLATGEVSVEAPAVSLTIGLSMNALKDTITQFQNNPPATGMTVNNNSSFNGGRDIETDEEYRLRLLTVDSEDSFGSTSYYQGLAQSIPGVHDILFVEPPTPNSENYTATVLINGDSKPTPNDVMIECIEALTLEENTVLKHNFYPTRPVYKDIALHIYVTTTESIPDEEFIECLNAVFNGGAYNNEEFFSVGLDIGFGLYKAELYNAIENITGVEQVTDITYNDEGTGWSKIDVEDNEVLLCNMDDLIITQDVVNG